MTWLFRRYDIEPTPGDSEYLYAHVPAGDGAHISAEEAINREAVNADRIRLLELQLKETRQLLRDTAATLEKVGGEQGHGASYSARELHADLFARIDSVIRSQ